MNVPSRIPAPPRKRCAVGPGAGAPVEPLEPRSLLSAAPEVQVNIHTVDHQRNPSIATDADGDYVVAWQSYQQEEQDWNVYARRYAADGTPLGDEFRVNQDTTYYNTDPSVAMDDAGNFVVSWTQGPVGHVFARRFYADGTPREDAFVVDWTAGAGTSSVAMDADGDFAIAWDIADEDTGRRNVFAQLYDRANGRWGIKQVNTNLLGSAWKPDVAMDDDGHFAVAFEVGEDAVLGGTYVRKYTNTSLALLPEVRVSSAAPSAAAPAVAMGGDGDYVVAWGDADGVRARRFRSFGVQNGSDVLVAATPSAQALDVTAGAGHDFLVTWSAPAADGHDVFARGYTPAGTPLSGAFRLNSHTPSQQSSPAAAMTGGGAFVAAWSSWGQDGDRTGVFARAFEAAAPPPASVVGRRVFYNRSSFDGGGMMPSAADDGAIAGQKIALLPGGTPSFLNVTSYTRGINGVMVDLADVPAGVTPGALDFSFRSSSGADPATWSAGPAPVMVATRQLSPGRHRVTLVWRDYSPQDAPGLPQAVANGWLEVTVNATERTGLAAPDVFAFGNLIGDTAGAPVAGALSVDATDAGRVRAGQSTSRVSVNNAFDFNRDGRVNFADSGVARSRSGASLALPIPAGAVTWRAPTSPAGSAGALRVGGSRGSYLDEVIA